MLDNRRGLSIVLPAARQPLEPRRGAERGVRELRQAWRQAAQPKWKNPKDWWAPEVDALADAIVGAQDALTACARLGRARAEAGVGLAEALDDLNALYLQLPSGGPPPGMVRALTEAWAEACVATANRIASCEDPLSGLTSTAYLRTRLAEVYREAARSRRNAGDEYLLIVVDASQALAESNRTGWDAILFRLRLGDALREVFSGGETLTAAGPSLVIGLLPREPELQSRVERLATELPRAEGLAGCKIWLEGLPGTLPAAHDALEYLAS
jgi:hypothetical protein